MPIRERIHFDKVDGARVGRFKGSLNTNFIIYRIGKTLIDSGPPNQWREVRTFSDEQPVTQLLLTHHHEDHSGNAARIAKRHQLTPYAPELGRKKLATGYKIPLLQKLFWGSPIPVITQPLPERMVLENGMKITAVHTPGHAKDLHCLLIPSEGWIFTADMFIARRLKYLRADENLGQLIASLAKIITLDFDTIFCAHRGILENGKPLLAQKHDNLTELAQQAQSLHQKGLEVDEIVNKTLGSDGMMAKLTNYNFSKRNLITEALKVDLT